MRRYLIKIFPLAVLSLFAFVGLRDLIAHQFYTSHDGFTHTARIAAYYQALADGQFPGRWAKNFYGGLGSPIFVYSYPLAYFLPAVGHMAGLAYEDGFRLLMAASYLFSGIFAFLWLKERFGGAAGLVGAVFYLWAPYRFLNIYVRAALAENLAYTFLPLALLGIDKLFGKRSYSWWGLLFVAFWLTFLSHNLVAAIFLPVACGWAALRYFSTRNKWAGAAFLLALGLAFLSCAFIYFPDLFERSFVRFDQGMTYWQDHFVDMRQIIKDRWDYGFDLPGMVNDAMSFQLGLANWLVLALLAAVSLYRRRIGREALFWVAVGAIALVLTIESSLGRWIWTSAPILKTVVDFPWRFLGLFPLAVAFLAAYFISLLPRWRSFWLALFLLVAIFVANRNHLRINQEVSFGDAAYDRYNGTATAAGSSEYTPVWHRSVDFPVAVAPVEDIGGGHTINRINVNRATARGLEFNVGASEAGWVRINRFYFPNTEVFLNGRLLAPGRDWEIIAGKSESAFFDDSGTIRLRVAPGGGQYELRFAETSLRRAANVVSVSSMLVAGGLAVGAYLKRKGNEK